MTTREALAAMKDRGDFESLATPVLRALQPDCAAVIHHGVNAQGEPVKAPVDAWCRVPNCDEPRFVLIQHTTTDREMLRGKWLGSGTGDFPKAATQAKDLREEFPNAKFRLFLTTNFVPDSALQRNVYSTASDAGMEAIIVDQSQLADYLDKPDGQYLRRKFLRIEADSLSKELLAEVSRKSVRLHAQRFLSGEIPVRIERKTDHSVRAALGDPTIALHALVADPGFGKSTTANLILSEHIDAGDYGLWIPESVLAEAISMEEAINRTLRSLHPAFSPDSASAWGRFCSEKRLLLLVEDINPMTNREELLRKLQGFTAPNTQESASASNRRFIALCPVWTHVWEATSTRDPNKEFKWISTTSLGPMLPEEATATVKELAAACHQVLSDDEAKECAENLNCDPYLLGIFGVLLKGKDTGAGPLELTRGVLPQYLKSVVQGAASRSEGKFTVADFEVALSAICRQMLLKKDLRPIWSRIRHWLKESVDSHVLEAAEFLRRDAVIYRLVDDDALVFRHDRLLQHLLAQNIAGLLDSDEVTGEVFYAEVLGQSLATQTINDGDLEEVAKRNPLALFEAIRAIGVPSKTSHEKIIAAVIEWVRRPEMLNEVPEALRYAIGYTLMKADSSCVSEISRYLPNDFGVLAASLRNGNTWAGVCLLGETGKHSFDPAVQQTWRAPALNQAIRNYREKLVSELQEILRRSNLAYEQSLGAILLSGYLMEPGLVDGIVACCRAAKNYEFLLPEAIWAVGRCCGKNAPDHLTSLVKLLAGVSEEKDKHDYSKRDGIRRNFDDFPTDTFHPDAVAYIIKIADEQTTLQNVLNALIHALDTPDAFEHLARYNAGRASASENPEIISNVFFFSKWGHRGSKRRLRPSESSRSRLRILWQSDAEDRYVRLAAFEIWSWSADSADIVHLQTVFVESPLFRSALWKRAELGDRDCIPELARCLRDDEWLARVAHRVWSAEICSVIENWLGQFVAKTLENPGNVADCIGTLLTRIPVYDGERLLANFWQGLREQQAFIQAALLISTSVTLALADEAISSKSVKEPFAHLATRMNDLRQKVPGWSVSQFLRGLEPYIDQLSPEELWHYPLDCRWVGESEWCRRHILPRMSDDQRRIHYADDVAIASELEGVAKDANRSRYPKFAIDRLLRNEADPRRIIDLALAAFQATPSLPRYAILAEAVATLGNRSDIPLFKQSYDEEWANAAEKLRADATFRLCRRTLAFTA